MNFFERQAAARRQSLRLLLLFALAVLCIVIAVCMGVALTISPAPWVMLLTACLTVLVIAAGSLYRIASLREGGAAVAQQMGGREVPADSGDFHLRRLRNVVEEIAIASGVPVPRLFVLEHEPGINAFAAGYAPSDAAIAVTRGALRALNRDELQGVVAHEFSHLLNGDMRLNIRLMGLLHGILMINLAGQKMTVRHIALTGIALRLAGAGGLLIGRLIKAGVSRSREMLADASAVQFTRQTHGLAGALKKIAGIAEGGRLRQRAQAEEISHMLFGDGLGFSGLFATHPPLLERIRALEPGFDAGQLEALTRRWHERAPDGLAEDRALGFSDVPLQPPPLPGAHSEVALTARQVVEQVAAPANEDYLAAGQLLHNLPDALHAMAYDHHDAIPLVLALLLADTPAVQARQQAEITRRLGAKTARDAAALAAGHIRPLHPMLRLPLAALAFPALRQHPHATLQTLVATCEALAHVDGEVSLFEYALSRMLQAQLRDAIAPAQRPGALLKLGEVRQEAATLLSVLAQLGHADNAAARRAYHAGSRLLGSTDALPYQPGTDIRQRLDTVWQPLDRLNPMAKQVLVEAIAGTVSHDGHITLAEAELLRAVCAILHCPLPPLLH